MAGTEVVEQRSDVLAERLLVRALLDEGAERRRSSSETGHDDRRRVEDGELQVRVNMWRGCTTEEKAPPS